MEKIDALVIGGGAVGMSTAYHLALEGVQTAVVEKESGPAMHQSGLNSGVIHAGYNPKPDTLKAKYCVEGNHELRAFCQDHAIPMREGGILIVAQNDQDLGTLKELERRGLANGTAVAMLGKAEMLSVEPHVSGIGALQAQDGASVDARAYVQTLASQANRLGTRLLYDRRVSSIEEKKHGIVVHTDKGAIEAGVAINAAGLYADVLAKRLASDMRIVPFRGYYAELNPAKTWLINSHVYATPDLNFPFLGVHLSRRTDGRVIVGPGAMLALGREAYSLASFRGGGLGRVLGWPGFYSMMGRPEFQTLLLQEVKKSFLVRAIAKEAMQLVPELRPRDLTRSYAGNRAQMVDRTGQLVDDIIIRDTPHAVHVLNVVSPGLTSSLPFGRHLAEVARAKL